MMHKDVFFLEKMMFNQVKNVGKEIKIKMFDAKKKESVFWKMSFFVEIYHCAYPCNHGLKALYSKKV